MKWILVSIRNYFDINLGVFVNIKYVYALKKMNYFLID